MSNNWIKLYKMAVWMFPRSKICADVAELQLGIIGHMCWVGSQLTTTDLKLVTHGCVIGFLRFAAVSKVLDIANWPAARNAHEVLDATVHDTKVEAEFGGSGGG
jgi:hypothetical protein